MKIFLKIFLPLAILFFGFSADVFAADNGCCVINKNIKGGEANCVKNAASDLCTGEDQLFLPNDASCNGPMAVSSCGNSSSNSILNSIISNVACCVSNSNASDCREVNSEGKCLSGYSLNLKKCSDINTCKTTAAASTGTSTTTEFVNPLGFTTVSELLNAVLNNLMGIIAIVAVIFIVIGGVLYIVSGGSEAGTTRAKKIWTGAVIGLAIALASPTFLKTIQSLLGGSSTGGSAETWVNNALTLKDIASNVLNLLLSIAGILGIIALIVGGGMYFTSYGDDKRIETGKKIITYAIIGIIVSLASLVIIRQVFNLISAQ